MIIWPDHPAFTTPLAELQGVGPKTLARLNEEGFFNTGDLLALRPKFYQDRRAPKAIADIAPDEEALVAARVVSARRGFSRRTRRPFQEAVVEDAAGDRLHLTWFNLPPYFLKSLTPGRPLNLFGRVKLTPRGPEMIHPDMEAGGAAAGEPSRPAPEIRPVYGPIGAIGSGAVKKLVDQALKLLEGAGPLFPAGWLAENNLADPLAALATLHAPPGRVKGKLPQPTECRAYGQLVFFELFFWRLMMLRSRAARPLVTRGGQGDGEAAVEDFWRTLPFRPSPEQLRVTAELAADLKGDRPMSRLLQGEVGGGKTAVAGAVLFYAARLGGQGAIMAPTEVLARQHYEFLRGPAESLGFRIALLTGSMSGRERNQVRAGLADGSIDIVAGSQALVSAATVFKNLSLAVIDEQHRFGVRQRLALRRKNSRVDLLAMSATPIPRSLALMLYGDLDSSSLKGLLPGRAPAATEIFEVGQRQAAYQRFLFLVGRGGQGFVISPRIGAEPSGDEEEPPRSLDDIFRDIQALAGPGLALGCLHGRQSAAERAEVMDSFRQGRINVLVATSIIEVGVDVPAARVILIEGAERFGLAQLHQLRGRVGRGGTPGHCLILPSAHSAASAARLAALARETDGVALAELDLKLRGPGEQLGLKQSGWPAMTYARLPRDLSSLARAHRLAEEAWAALAEKRGPWPEVFGRLDMEGAMERLAATAPEAA